jgi:7-carboxy-7-deazaguanine synthase
MKEILVSEIFGPVLQGEGALIGRPTLFVRTGGCDFRCDWCDTLYAVLPEYRADWMPMTVGPILSRLDELSRGMPMLVTLSGGNPALQPLAPLIDEGHARGYSFALETQGSVARDWFSKLDYLVLSPKPPSAKVPMDDAKLAACIAGAQSGTDHTPQISLKVVVFDEDDYQFARAVHQRYPDIPFYLQAGNPFSKDDNISMAQLTARLRELGERVLADGWHDVTVLPQMHVLIYGNRRGV